MFVLHHVESIKCIGGGEKLYSFRKKKMKSLTIQGFCSSLLWHWTHSRKQSCSRMAMRREKHNFPFTPEFSDGHVSLYSSSLTQRSYARIVDYTCKNIWRGEAGHSSLNSCIWQHCLHLCKFHKKAGHTRRRKPTIIFCSNIYGRHS